MTNEPADVSDAGRDDDQQAPVGLPAEPIDTDPAGKFQPEVPDDPTGGEDVPVEQGSGGADE